MSKFNWFGSIVQQFNSPDHYSKFSLAVFPFLRTLHASYPWGRNNILDYKEFRGLALPLRAAILIKLTRLILYNVFFQFLKRFVSWMIGDSGAVAFLSLKTARSSAAAGRMESRGVLRYVRRKERSLFAARMKD